MRAFRLIRAFQSVFFVDRRPQKFIKTTPTIIAAMPTKCLNTRISPKTSIPIAAVAAVPTPDQIAARERGQCLSANVKSVKELANTNSSVLGIGLAKLFASFMQVAPATSRMIVRASSSTPFAEVPESVTPPS
eukprot:05455_4